MAWSTFPLESDPTANDGIVLRTGFLPGGNETDLNLGDVLVHEAGHYLGLYHTFDDFGQCKDGDGIGDTPIHLENSECPPSNTNTCEQFPGFDPINNYMNKTDDECRWEFTEGQIMVMSSEVAEKRITLGQTNILFNSSRTINSGDSWKLFAGNYCFSNGTQLIVHGKIDADGATFQAQSGATWYGITVDGTSKSEFDNCTIKGGTYGIIVDGSTYWSPDIYYCNIQGNTAGIWIKNNGNPYVYNSFIKGVNGTAAVWSTNNSDGFFQRCKLYGTSTFCHKNDNSSTPCYNYYNSGRNIFDAVNGPTIYVFGGIMGLYDGKNAIYKSSQNVHFINSTGPHQNARYNYWSGITPQFTGDVDCSSYLTQLPNPLGPNWSLSKSSDEQNNDNLLAEAWQSYYNQDYARAKELAKNIFDENILAASEEEISTEALFLSMKSSLRQGKLQDVENSLLLICNNSELPKAVVYESLRWLSKIEVNKGNLKKAEELALSVPASSHYGKELLFDAAVEIMEKWGDIEKASVILDKLTEKFPDNETLKEKQLVLNLYSGNLNSFSDSLRSQPQTLQEPITYNLSEAYPNPFNPTTTIIYSIPQPNNVTLKIFDVLGREVSTLVNEFQTEGRYQVQFNASSLASGIYFYRLQTGSYVQTKKLIIAK